MPKRTRLNICAKKRRYADEDEVLAAIRRATITLRHYRCDRCEQFHLTSRTKGKFGAFAKGVRSDNF
jgi:hypothetical protein